MAIAYEAAPQSDYQPIAVDFEKIKVVSRVSVKFKLE